MDLLKLIKQSKAGKHQISENICTLFFRNNTGITLKNTCVFSIPFRSLFAHDHRYIPYVNSTDTGITANIRMYT